MSNDEIRYEQTYRILKLALAMQFSKTAFSLKDIGELFGVSRRTAQRMIDVVMSIYPQVVELPKNGKAKLWKFVGQPIFFYDFSAKELAQLNKLKEFCEINNKIAYIKILDKVIDSIKIKKDVAFSNIENDVEILTSTDGFAVKQGCNIPFSNETTDLIRTAIMSMKKLQFDYRAKEYFDIDEKNIAGFKIQKGLKPQVTLCVEPLGILNADRIYLIAKNKDKIRQYAIQRMQNIKISKENYVYDSTFKLKEWVQKSFNYYHDDSEFVELKFDKAISEYVLSYNFHPTQRIKTLDDGSIYVSFECSDMRSVLWNLFTWGNSVEILSPKSLIDKYKAYMQCVLDIYK